MPSSPWKRCVYASRIPVERLGRAAKISSSVATAQKARMETIGVRYLALTCWNMLGSSSPRLMFFGFMIGVTKLYFE